MMSGVRREIDVREHVFQIGPVLGFGGFVVIKSVVDELSQIGNFRLGR